MIAKDNLARYLDKWEQTIGYAYEHFTKSSEAAAAQHCADRVFYSPIAQRLHELKGDLDIVRNLLEEE